MGSASSKAARKLPTTAKQSPSWAGARTGEPPVSSSDPNASRAPPRAQGPLASESRDAAVEADAQDPQFMANLGRLGPVKVDHHMSTFRTGAAASAVMFRSRAEAELQANSNGHTARNHVQASDLVLSLQRRQELGVRASGLEREAQKTGIDPAVLQRVARFVNAPSVVPGSERSRVDEDGVEQVERLIHWVEPRTA